MWLRYESGAEPGADPLAKAAEFGIDVYYVLTGQRVGGSTALTARETALVENYRAAPEAGKLALDTTSASLAGGSQAPVAQKQTNFSIGSVSGTVVEGGQVNNGPVNFGKTPRPKK